ncbi:MAG: 3'(2'),5'-bisphosphate nucleotidase CysQ [Rikenellaceae bacterium]|nr:3'(2'),5'-bisphosphate nucleotidase CysQ [Rikenellaceae bacterium]
MGNEKLTDEQRSFLLPYAYNAALRVGSAILEIYENAEDMDVAIKTDKTPITLAGKQAHRIIREYLALTHVPLLSEEGREMIYEERRGWDLYWMVDPLDGTKEFLKGNGEFTVNIALMLNNRPVLAVVYVPYVEKIYFCDRETGSFRKLHVTSDAAASFAVETIMEGAEKLPLTTEPNNPIKIAVSRSHNNEETYRYVEMIKRKFPDAEIVEQGSSYKFCMLAEGVVDCYIRTSNTYEWDTAAGELILEVAEGATRALPSKDRLEYNKISLLNPSFICKSKFMPDFL